MIELEGDDFIRAFVNGDNKAFEVIYKRYYPGLFATCFKLIKYKGSQEDAKDIVSITLAKLFERRDKIDSPAGITRFLYLAVRTGAIDFLRKKGRVIETPHDPSGLQEINDEIDVGFWETLEREKRVMDMVSGLPDRSREVIFLFYVKGLKYREIGEQLNISTRTVENLLRFALDKLRNALAGKGVSTVFLLTTAAFAGIFAEALCIVLGLYISGMLSNL